MISRSNDTNFMTTPHRVSKVAIAARVSLVHVELFRSLTSPSSSDRMVYPADAASAKQYPNAII